ncbi:hypothetical protein FXW07_13810 [Methanosarcina sp. DH1]|uniref:hypothetical protein n=1 Tax=Methanosarcina sp. DH1 TaxID=2605695 RepID=UPI001E454C33|nr:hypothetical protein [Methanosarcina sp. DH1]MCC4767648.1 hypothetical protein [Methanosarcina sp. DH1]
MRKLYIMCFTLIVLLSTSMSVQAMESKTIERQSGSSAYANWYETNGDVTTYTYMSVTETDDGTDICLDIYTSGPDYCSEKWGYMFTEDDVFSIDKKLNSASLSDIELEVTDWNTGETDTVTVGADWTGTGEISTGSSTSKSTTGDYVWRSSENSKYRGASATGSINGMDLGISTDASMSNFKSAYMSMEK